MYQPAAFVATDPQALQTLIRTWPLALLVRHGPDGLPLADALPLQFDPPAACDPGLADAPHGRLWGHLARANPLVAEAQAATARDPAGLPVLAVFQGPQGHVSPSAYPSKAEHGRVVPTWNYTLVQARGRLRLIDEPAAKRALLARQTAVHEAGRPHPWGIDDAPPDYIDAMLRALVGLTLTLDAPLLGKFKLSQNRSDADRAGVVADLQAQAASARAAGAVRSEAAQLARWVAVGGPDSELGPDPALALRPEAP